MNVRATVVVIFGLSLACASRLDAADPQTASPAPAPSSPTLEEQLDALDHADAELAAAQEELKTAEAAAQRRALRARIDALRAEQERLVSAIEHIVGPLPPRVQTDRPTLAEQQLDAQQRHHEAMLEHDVERRLPRP